MSAIFSLSTCVLCLTAMWEFHKIVPVTVAEEELYKCVLNSEFDRVKHMVVILVLDSTFQEAITGIPRGNYGDVVWLLLTVVFGSDLCGIDRVEHMVVILFGFHIPGGNYGHSKGNYGDVVCLLLTVVFGSDLCGIHSLDKSVTTLGIHMFSRTVVIAYVFPRIAWL